MINGVSNTAAGAYGATAYQNHQKANNADADVKKSKGREDDKVSISDKGALSAQKSAWSKEVAKGAQDEFTRLRVNLIKALMKEFGGEDVNWENIFSKIEDSGMSVEELLEKMPDEWKPDAVAERIVNFSVAFYEQSGLSGEEFYEKIKQAIDDGFSAASQKMGDKLPDSVTGITELTRQAAYEKLNQWAESKGIQIPTDK